MSRELLFLAHRIPYPPDKGDKIRSFHELQYLAERGWAVHLCALADDPGDLEYVAELERLCASVAVEPISPRGQRVRSVRGPLRGLPLSVLYFYNPRLQRRVDEVLRTRPIQTVFCFSGPMAEYLFRSAQLPAPGPRLPGIPASQVSGGAARPRLVMDLVDVDSDKWKQYARRRHWPLSWVYELEGRLLAEYERRVAEAFDATTLVSLAEAAVFRSRTGLSDGIYSVGNGVDLDYFHPACRPPGLPTSGPPSVVFCGAMDYFPNVDAVTWFANDVLPILQARIPRVGFSIVGARPTRQVLALESASVRVTGRVDDVRGYVSAAQLSVAPIRVARGIQNKVLEAMAMGRPVVATPAAFEGIEAQPGRDLVVEAPDAQRFAQAVTELLEDPKRADELGRSARVLVEGRYRWEQQLSALDRVLRVS